MGFNSYRYPRYHLALPTAADDPWTPVPPAKTAEPDDEVPDEIDLTTIDLRVAEGSVTSF